MAIVTITPKEKVDGSGRQYLLLLDPVDDTNVWVKCGLYDTVDSVLNAFLMPLNPAFRNAVIIRLNEHKPINFRLEEAFEQA